jgi:tetratricopeptide (TPR) repeat protein
MSSASDPHAGSKNQKAQTFFQYGNDAALKSNFDYAIQMYREACKLAPDNLKFRQALRGIARRKYGNEPAKVGRLVGARTQPIKLKARAARGKGHWEAVLEVCEEVFVHNPWDVHAARDAAEAAEQLGHKELAQWLLESVQSVASDIDFFRHLAHAHELNASWAKAIAAWERVKKINPYDEDASKQINALSASATIMRAGLGETLHKRSADAPADAVSSELDELRAPQLSPEERWQKEIAEDPTMVGPYLQYSDHLKQRGQLDDAEKLLSRGLKAVPEDAALKMMHSEVQIARINRAIASWTAKARERPDDPAPKARLEQLQTMLLEYETEEYRRRIKLNPGDFNLQYELGVRLARAGKHKEAIPAFQQARSSPALKVEALRQCGLSFEAEGQLKLAERQYQEALKAADREEMATLNSLHYQLGRVYEAMGNTQAAEEHYNEVAANDYGYLDVAQRLRNLS